MVESTSTTSEQSKKHITFGIYVQLIPPQRILLTRRTARKQDSNAPNYKCVTRASHQVESFLRAHEPTQQKKQTEGAFCSGCRQQEHSSNAGSTERQRVRDNRSTEKERSLLWTLSQNLAGVLLSPAFACASPLLLFAQTQHKETKKKNKKKKTGRV